MTVIQIGSFAILTKWFNLGISILLSLILLWCWLTFYKRDVRRITFDIISGNVILGFFIWKASLFIFEPKLVLQSPLSFLYFTGGSKGLLISILIAAILTIYQLRKKGIATEEVLFIINSFSFATFGIFNGMSWLLLIENNVYHLLIGLAALYILCWLLLSRRKITVKNMFTILIIFSLYHIIITLICSRGFYNLENWFLIGVIIISLFLWDKDFRDEELE